MGGGRASLRHSSLEIWWGQVAEEGRPCTHVVGGSRPQVQMREGVCSGGRGGAAGVCHISGLVKGREGLLLPASGSLASGCTPSRR